MDVFNLLFRNPFFNCNSILSSNFIYVTYQNKIQKYDLYNYYLISFFLRIKGICF